MLGSNYCLELTASIEYNATRLFYSNGTWYYRCILMAGGTIYRCTLIVD